MNSNDFKAGDILMATHRELKKGRHYIVYLEGNSDRDFIGAMITHHSSELNVSMGSDHFVDTLEFPVKYDGSYLVIGRFYKPESWGPFKKVGELTLEGVDFVKSITNHLPKETFKSYYKRTRS